MTFENTSIFTTIGWDGDRKFFAIEEHLDRLEIYANKTGKTFDDKVKLNIKKKLKNHVFSNINEKSIDNLCKPPGLVKIKLNSDGDIFISDRSNKKNRKCKFVKAITIEAPANLKMNKGIKSNKALIIPGLYKFCAVEIPKWKLALAIVAAL